MSELRVVYGRPAGEPGTTVIEGFVCSTCGLPLVVPLFHPGQAEITDHKPTVELTAAEPRWPSGPDLDDVQAIVEAAERKCYDQFHPTCHPAIHRFRQEVLAALQEKA